MASPPWSLHRAQHETYPCRMKKTDLGKCFTLFPAQKELWWKVLEERERCTPTAEHDADGSPAPKPHTA